MTDITIIKPDDFHIHLRQGDALPNYAMESAKQFNRGIIMPNTTPPVISVKDINEYRSLILEATTDFEPLMTFKILPLSDPSEIEDLKRAGVIAGKYYPAGATTNSQDGITNWKTMIPVLKEMERVGMVLSIHGEIPDSFILDREKDFLPVLEAIHGVCPNLKIVLEHLSCSESVECIKNMPDHIGATITLHHLISTIEDVISDTNNKCMPIPKLPKDREAIRDVVFSGNKKFFFGSDSAPHSIDSKDCFRANAGVYTAPVLLPKLVELFDNNNALELLENFVSRFGAEFYGLEYNRQTITLIKKPMVVPTELYGVRPYLSGETITWSL